MDAEELRDFLDALEEKLGHRFSESRRLMEALTHRSWAHEQPDRTLRSNDRLEFLGDAVLELAISHLLFKRFPELTEGGLTKFRSALVNRNSLAQKARSLGLGEVVLLGKGEEKTRSRLKPSILADTFEAVLGALYMDGGFGAAISLVERIFSRELTQEPESVLGGDFKTLLQERTHTLYGRPPSYRLEAEEGPDHHKSFVMFVMVEGSVLGVGRGTSKKEAQQEAAREALLKIEEAS